MLMVPLPREPTSGAHARQELSRHLHELLGPDRMDDARLIASELVNNAYLHGRGDIEMHVEVLRDRVRIAVRDQGANAHLRVQFGHGLQLVQDLSLAWGAYDAPTRVWAELAIAL
jgi:anti-sigma regulatory factor (Ser/Thr protein kinase)